MSAIALKARRHFCPPAGMLATLRRETRAALLNRYGQVFAGLAIAGGIAATLLSEDPGATTFILLQISLYLVSLFALLTGVSSARAESEEWPILLAQPVARSTIVIGKWIALVGLFAVELAILFAPAFASETPALDLIAVYFQALALAAVVGSIGLCAGFLSSDRVQALITSVGVWLFLLVGADLISLFAAQWPLIQKAPNAWIVTLMVNPLDAFRIQTLFSLGQIPPESANKAALASWWLSHCGVWLAVITWVWTTAMILLANWRFRRTEP